MYIPKHSARAYYPFCECLERWLLPTLITISNLRISQLLALALFIYKVGLIQANFHNAEYYWVCRSLCTQMQKFWNTCGDLNYKGDSFKGFKVFTGKIRSKIECFRASRNQTSPSFFQVPYFYRESHTAPPFC